VLKLKTGEILDEPRDGFKIAGRVRHVVSEGRRVKEAARALEEGDVSRFGELMNESHESCARDYEMSTPELDKLVEICREEGALGARLTGAGFGGCAIALVCDHDLPDFVSAIISRYYNDYLQGAHEDIPMSTLALEDAIFPCKPCGAAGLLL
jgi:N-acetylgalactosamine kinase